MSPTGFLAEMLERSRARAAELQNRAEELALKARERRRNREPHRLATALARKGPNVIAEIKRRSPSAGTLSGRLAPETIARGYANAGASAISVITEPSRFDGALSDLVAVRKATTLPLLRKDFLCAPSQVFESAVAGADAVLLIVAMLADSELRTLLRCAHELGMDALVEVHTAEELQRALAAGCTLIGVNNRDLASLQVDVNASHRLASHFPPEVLLVSESGLREATQLRELKRAGYNGFLIGEAFMRADEPGRALATLIAETSRTRTKICGVTDEASAEAVVQAGADLIGINFYPLSPRAVSVEAARAIVRRIADRCETVGIFVNESPVMIAAVAADAGLSRVQLHGDKATETANSLAAFKPIVATHNIAALPRARSRSLLVDAQTALYGGSGQLADWEGARQAREHCSELVLAGGLHADNVADAIAAVNPDIVDACSRLESRPGKKETHRVRAFIEAVRVTRRSLCAAAQ